MILTVYTNDKWCSQVHPVQVQLKIDIRNANIILIIKQALAYRYCLIYTALK